MSAGGLRLAVSVHQVLSEARGGGPGHRTADEDLR